MWPEVIVLLTTLLILWQSFQAEPKPHRENPNRSLQPKAQNLHLYQNNHGQCDRACGAKIRGFIQKSKFMVENLIDENNLSEYD